MVRRLHSFWNGPPFQGDIRSSRACQGFIWIHGHILQVWDCGTWAEAAKLKSGRRAEPKDGCRTVVGDDVIRESFK